jgi:protein-disulfide isomerase
MNVLANKQRGMGLGGLIMVIAAVLFVVVLGMKLLPTYAHNYQIESLFKKIVNDPEMQNATVKDIRASYTKRALIDYINDLAADDIEITKDDGHITLGASYSVKIPVAGNVSFLIEFKPSATK